MTTYDVMSYQDRLTAMRSRLMQEVDAAEATLRDASRSTGDLSHLPTHPADHDSAGLDEQVAIAENEARMLHEVEEALQRIHEGTYGQCLGCGCSIDQLRLDAIPYTAWCIDCAREQST